MRLYRSGNYYVKAALGWLLAALFLGYQGVVIVRALVIGIAANWRDFTSLALFLTFGFFFIGIMLILDTYAVIRPLTYAVHERRLRAAEQRNPLITPPVAFQPRPELALHDGETLKLERVRSAGDMFRFFLVSLAVVAVLVASGETFIIALLPSLAQSSLNPFNTLLDVLLQTGPATPIADLSPLDWASFALPFVIGGWLMIQSLFELVRSRRVALIADDRGVTSIRSGQMRQFIPWSDVAVFQRSDNNMSDAPRGSYFIWGQEHGLNFQIAGTPTIQMGAQPSRARQARSYRFVGGAEAYERDARRLLATIAARSYQPLAYWVGSAKMFADIQRRFPLTSLSVENAYALPLAEAPLQPSEAAVAAARQSAAPSFTLKSQLTFSWPALLIESLIYFVVLGALVYIGSASSGTLITPASVASGDLISLVVLAIFVPFCAAFAVLFALARLDRRGPGVTVTATGLKGLSRSGQSKKPVEIAWEDIRAWAVLPATHGSKRPTRFIVLSDEREIVWAEPEGARLAGKGVQGDRGVAFRERVAEIHALIVARTGLPLRDASRPQEGKPGVSEAPRVVGLDVDSW